MRWALIETHAEWNFKVYWRAKQGATFGYTKQRDLHLQIVTLNDLVHD